MRDVGNIRMRVRSISAADLISIPDKITLLAVPSEIIGLFSHYFAGLSSKIESLVGRKVNGLRGVSPRWGLSCYKGS
jgi:hypothetical protein